MRVMMSMTWNGVTAEQYEKIRKTVNWERDVPKGAVFHVSSFGPKAMHVTDVWESAEDFNSFVEKRLMPAIRQIGVTSQPSVNMFPVHKIFSPAFSEKKR